MGGGSSVCACVCFPPPEEFSNYPSSRFHVIEGGGEHESSSPPRNTIMYSQLQRDTTPERYYSSVYAYYYMYALHAHFLCSKKKSVQLLQYTTSTSLCSFFLSTIFYKFTIIQYKNNVAVIVCKNTHYCRCLYDYIVPFLLFHMESYIL